jgi:hypothetical protein
MSLSIRPDMLERSAETVFYSLEASRLGYRALFATKLYRISHKFGGIGKYPFLCIVKMTNNMDVNSKRILKHERAWLQRW